MLKKFEVKQSEKTEFLDTYNISNDFGATACLLSKILGIP